ncbi:MAG: phosphate ABC transporter substrate-binding protein [Acidobacteriota bacterium]
MRSLACARAASLALALGTILGACAGTSAGRREVVRLAGSDTMLLLVRRWAEEFMRGDPALVTVEGGGTAAGIEALIAGSIDVCAASRPLAPEEVERLFKRTGSLGVRFLVARDALSVYVNPANPVRNLTLLQLKGVFTGRVGSWHKLGGVEAPIHVLLQPPNSGSARFFQNVALDGEPFAPRGATLPTTQAIVAAVEADPLAIGFGGLAYGASVTLLDLEGTGPGQIRSAAYPLSRYLYLYTVREPAGATRRLIDSVLTPAGQSIVEQVGFVPLWDSQRERHPAEPQL